MDVLSFALLFIFVNSIRSECVIDNRSKNTVWEQKLREDLTACDSRYQPPSTNETLVNISFTLKSFYFEHDEEIFTISSWVFLTWNDLRLTWNPDNYDGITEILLSSMKIWTPKLSHYSSSGEDEFDYIMTACRITAKGHITCIPRVVHQTVCSTKLTHWPFDTQNCTFEFGSKPGLDRAKFVLDGARGIKMLGAEYGPGWTIVDFSKSETNDSESIKFSFNFILQREGVGLAAIVIVPSLVLSFITVWSMTLNVDDQIRLGMLCFGLLGHFTFLQEINSDLPKHSADTPTVLLYLRSSIILTLLAIGITFLLMHLCKKSKPPSNFIVTINEKVFESYARYIIWPKWNTTGENQNDVAKILTAWIDFASIINFVFMLIIVVTYTVMYSIYIPKDPDF
ncbi:PREDICTED: neuronal acetylcholine receptor subunit beta-2-like [Papilio xuthus]|uniref:Neuronal acetylcholine receptor subunit beta-2-like n=1 Tax=Papilio xuthus TaxID=66420 RepID=A0AAJ7EA32_PAPXU|nr:PREDICTED: neuronal acetylcholine receptor subunit beta-2-like [Papilio xuthus]